jgi:death on curing protein
LETENIQYISYVEAVAIHFEVMDFFGEIRCGVMERTLIESALARAQQAAAYENADLIRQAATLCFGLIKNHPWVGGNKRTATAIVDEFLYRNRIEVRAKRGETYRLVLAVESDQYGVEEIELWYRQRASPVATSD